ncbi:Tfp pilus assembly protein PilF [Desulfacinum hydrothermale DSM 13146]|uniref:Tfp pilus assembly protein PilF n=1 Tax=Desulfacinum hydrothermale DSM 13146 TaxID=1121390 RepID=A0A1W1XS62_9BACT|nr:tetratricopeptide repeat protein [Desulfacinum hydrothermale]SMC26736.1 Tfp pilus assembly protein PilF [Desulfacinum hydrothermale DSM 13146]
MYPIHRPADAGSFPSVDHSRQAHRPSAPFRTWAAVSVLVLLVLAGCASREEKIAQFIQSGHAYMEKNDPARAAIQYKNALQLDPRNLPAHMGLARAYEAMGDFQRALGTYRRVLELDPQRDDARLGAARLLTLGRRPDQALKELDRISDPQALQPQAAAVRARALLALKRAQEAAAVLEKAPGVAESREATALLALAYDRLEREDAFQSALERWRQLDLKDPGSYLLGARHAARRGRKEEALTQVDLMVQALQGSADARLLQARTLEQLGYAQEAAAAFDALPDQSKYLRERAAFALRRADRSKAQKILEKLARRTPDDPQTALALARVLEEGKDPDAALAVLDRHLPRMGSDADREKLQLAKAELLSRQGRFQEAEKLCRAILQDNQGSASAHLLLARLLARKKDFETAELHANQAAAALADNPEAQLLLARIQQANGKRALAQDTLKQALERRPDAVAVRAALVESLIQEGKDAQALALAEKVLERRPDDPSWLRVRGQLRARTGKEAGAEADFRRLIELRPDSPVGYLDLGQLQLAQKKLKDAQASFQTAADLAPRWTAPHRALARLYLSQGRPEEALREAETAYQKTPTAELAVHLAGLYEYQGRTKDAITVYEKALTRWGERPELLNNLAYLISQDDPTPDRLQRARALVQKALQARPRYPAYLDTLAVIAHKQGRLDEAWKTIQQVLRLNPENGEHQLHAAQIARDRGDPDAASQYAQKALEAGLPPRLQPIARALARRGAGES